MSTPKDDMRKLDNGSISHKIAIFLCCKKAEVELIRQQYRSLFGVDPLSDLPAGPERDERRAGLLSILLFQRRLERA
jgi:hypothetical protein